MQLRSDRTGERRDRSVTARPLRVMHLVYRLAGGGMEHNIVKLANGHDRAHVVPSLCSCQPADRLKELLHPSVPLFELARRDGQDVRFLVQLVRLLRRERPDILHTHSWGTLGEGFLAARLAGVPLVVHGEHGTMDTRRLNVRVQRFLWNRVDSVLSVSSRLAERMADVVGFSENRITVIRNGVDLTRVTGGDRRVFRSQFGIREPELTIGTIGRLEPVKDHAMLLTALAMLRSRGVAFRAVVVGGGSLDAALRQQTVDLGLQDSVHFAGARSDVHHALAAMDVFVMPSRSEGLSNTIMEAMAAGLPVVATDVGGARELIADGETGRLVPAGSPGPLADALARLLGCPGERAAMATAARALAAREFSLTKMVRQYEELYRTVAFGRLSSPRARNFVTTGDAPVAG